MTSAWFYDAEGHDKQVELTEAIVAGLEEQQLLWIDLERSDAKGIDEATAVLALSSHSRSAIEVPPVPPKIDNYTGYFQLSVPLPSRTEKSEGRLDFLVSEKWVMTVRDREIQFLVDFREQDRGESFRGKLTPAALTASLLDWHLESFQSELTEIQKGIDKIDADIFARRERKRLLPTLAVMRQRVSRLRDALGDHRPIIYGLLRPDFEPIADTPAADYFRALERHFERAEDSIESARETVIGSFDLYAARTAQETNDVVRTLTVATVIIGSISAVACILGMNFETPIAKTGTLGFVITIVSMLVSSVIAVAVAKWRKWL